MGKWLAPLKPPAHKFYNRQVTIPAGADFLAIFNGLVVDLTFPYNWEGSADYTPDTIAAAFAPLVDQFLTAQNEPPFAEDPEELGGETKQAWYEDLADWVISGFLAVTFTPGAAIVYQTVIPKLRLAIRTNDVGAAFKVLLNGLEIATGDSYSPLVTLIDQVLDLQQFAIDNDLGDPPWTLRVEHNDGPGKKLEVVRNPLAAPVEGVALMVGSVLWGAWSSVPSHCLACDGASYLKSAYPYLWAVLDATYEDDSTHFHVPDLRGRAALGNGQGSGLTNRAMDDTGGAETHELTVGELPAHSHNVYPNTTDLSFELTAAAGAYGMFQAIQFPTSETGDNDPHENMPPFNVLRAVIVADNGL